MIISSLSEYKMLSLFRPYFEMKDRLESCLQQERQSVEDLQRALTASKERYQGALHNLEQISEEIHLRRKEKGRVPLPPRTPGVGAETCDDQTDLPAINLGMGNFQYIFFFFLSKCY